MSDYKSNYNTDMDAAHKTAETLLLVIPTGDADHPLTVEIGNWDGEEWTGEWRHTEMAYCENDPIAWAPVPEIDAELYARFPFGKSDDDGSDEALAG